jgi:hypothetical protein
MLFASSIQAFKQSLKMASSHRAHAMPSMVQVYSEIRVQANGIPDHGQSHALHGWDKGHPP